MGPASARALIDWHTHVWLPEHLGADHAAEMAARTGRDTTATPERHRAAMEVADKFVVIGIKWGRLGANVPNEYTAKYVAQYPDRAIGFACVDPADASAAEELERSITELGLKGLKLSPVYQGFDPWSPVAWRLYEVADALRIPIMFHQAAAFPAQAVLEYGNPVLLDKIARSFPRLKMIVAHLGQPWVEETVQLLRKHKSMFADLSARYYRRWQFYHAMQLALDYQVTGQLLFGSDFPMQTTQEAVTAFRAVGDFGPGVSLPAIPEAVIESILYERPFELLGV